MLGKIIDGRLQIAGNIIKTNDGKIITNPTDTILKQQGYKEVIYKNKPEYNDEEQKLIELYSETDTEINVDYNIIDLTTEEHNEIIKYKIVIEENKMTKRNIRGGVLDNEFDKNELNKIENAIAVLRGKLR